MSKDLHKSAAKLQQPEAAPPSTLVPNPGLKLEHGDLGFVISYKSVEVRAPYPPRGDKPATHTIFNWCGWELALKIQSAYGPEELNWFLETWQSIPPSIVEQRL